MQDPKKKNVMNKFKDGDNSHTLDLSTLTRNALFKSNQRLIDSKTCNTHSVEFNLETEEDFSAFTTDQFNNIIVSFYIIENKANSKRRTIEIQLNPHQLGQIESMLEINPKWTE